MMEILSPVLELQAKDFVSERRELEVPGGIGFVWGIPPTFRLIIHCLKPITPDGATVKIGITSGEIVWVYPTSDSKPGTLNPEGRYPIPIPSNPVTLTHGKLLDVIANLVGDPLSR